MRKLHSCIVKLLVEKVNWLDAVHNNSTIYPFIILSPVQHSQANKVMEKEPYMSDWTIVLVPLTLTDTPESRWPATSVIFPVTTN